MNADTQAAIYVTLVAGEKKATVVFQHRSFDHAQDALKRAFPLLNKLATFTFEQLTFPFDLNGVAVETEAEKLRKQLLESQSSPQRYT